MKIIISLSLSMVFVLGLASFVSAGPLDGATAKLGGALDGTGLAGGDENALADQVGTVVKAILSLVGTIFLLLTVYSGILWMTASGKEEQIEKARNIITAAVIGLFITMSAYAITYFVSSKAGGLGGGSGTGDNKGCCYAANKSVCADGIISTECAESAKFELGKLCSTIVGCSQYKP